MLPTYGKPCIANEKYLFSVILWKSIPEERKANRLGWPSRGAWGGLNCFE